MVIYYSFPSLTKHLWYISSALNAVIEWKGESVSTSAVNSKLPEEEPPDVFWPRCDDDGARTKGNPEHTWAHFLYPNLKKISCMMKCLLCLPKNSNFQLFKLLLLAFTSTLKMHILQNENAVRKLTLIMFIFMCIVDGMLMPLTCYYLHSHSILFMCLYQFYMVEWCPVWG